MAWYNPFSWGAEDPERYVADKAASTFGGPRHDYDIGAATAAGSTIDRGEANQVRGQQQGLADLLRMTATGGGPSAAKITGQAERDANFQQAAALQSARRGGNAGTGARLSMQNIVLGNQSAGQRQSAGLANEMAAARGELGGVLGGMRNSDTALALQQAQMDQQNNQFNAGQTNQVAQGNQQTSYGIGAGELGAHMQQEGYRFQDLDPGQEGWFGNALGLGAQVGSSLGSAAILASDVNAKTGVRPLSDTPTHSYAAPRRRTKSAAINSAIDSVRPTLNFLSNAILMKALESGAKSDERAKTKPKAESSPPPDYWAGQRRTYDARDVSPRTITELGPDGLPLINPTISDERSKRRAEKMLDELTPYSYEYRDDARMGDGRHAGVMWQDLMKTPAGREMDGGVDPETGYHQVDYGKGLSTMMAGIASLNERLDKIERKRRG